MLKFALRLAYVGSRYCGWQKQSRLKNSDRPALSIQQTIEEALQKMTGETPPVIGSGRTDAGVHARAQVAHFSLKNERWKERILHQGLNSILPRDIRVLSVAPAHPKFHAQRSAVKKQYSYYFQQGPCAYPDLEPFSWWIRKQLNIEAMNRGLEYLLGEHDFRAFQAAGAKIGKSTLRTILEAEVKQEPVRFPQISISEVSMVRVRILGTGFLKQMIRGIAGTLLQIGENRREPTCFQEILSSADRSKVGPTAPARALWLEEVGYPEDIGPKW